MSDNLNEILKNLDQNKLKSLVNSKTGIELAKRLTESDKKKLINELNKIDSTKIKQKLNEINNGNLKKLNANEIIKKLNNL